MSTQDNLKEAFAGESQANRKYLAFAKQAEKDGFANVANLFRAVAEAETIHAHAHLKAMDGVGSTADNLKAAIEGEAYEFTHMYPGFIETAEQEGNKRAAVGMRHANDVEKVHHDLFQAALKAIEAGEDLGAGAIHVCDVCGHTHIGEPPERCPVCNAKSGAYSTVA